MGWRRRTPCHVSPVPFADGYLPLDLRSRDESCSIASRTGCTSPIIVHEPSPLLNKRDMFRGANVGSGADFRKRQAKAERRRKSLSIRPGANWPVEFASQEKVSRNETFSDEFIEKIIGLDCAWISDESSLWDFHSDRTNEPLCAKIREVYGVDVSDNESSMWSRSPKSVDSSNRVTFIS